MAGLALVLILFDWNWLKGPIESRVSAALGREFRIVGPLDVDLSRTPRITALDVRLANPAWASDGPMLKVARAEIVVDLGALLRGRIELPTVSIVQPELRLETRPDGPPNWVLERNPTDDRPRMPEIGQLQVADASVSYLEHGSGRAVAASLDQVTGSTGNADAGMTLALTGRIGAQPLDLKLTGPPVAQLMQRAEPYPVAIDLRLAESDLSGEVRVDLGDRAPAVSASLRSDQVRMADLATLADAARSTTGNTLRGLDLDLLPALAAELDLTVQRLEGDQLTLQDLRLQAGLRDRRPTLALTGNGSFRGEPVVLDVRAGPIERGQTPDARYRIDARVEAGQTRLSAAGAIDQPETLQGLDLRLEASSADAAGLLRQLGVDLPAWPELQASGRLVRAGPAWRLADLHAEVGESDLSGEVTVDLSGPRPFLTADLRSDRLLAADLMPAPQATEAATDAAAEPSPTSPPIITASRIELEDLPDIDADFRLAAADVQLPEVAFDQLRLDLKLRDRIVVVDATGQGRFRDYQPVAFEAHAGSAESLEDPAARYPIDLTLAAGDTRASVKGSVDRALDATGLDLEVTLEGPNLQALGEILQLPLPATPPYDLAGRVSHQPDQQRWNLVAIEGRVGDSDLAGDVSLELAGERPTVVADLRSQRLDFDDLGVLVGAPPDTQPGETASAKAGPFVLPDQPFGLPELRAIDARIKLEAATVEAKILPLERMSLSLTLIDGRITFEPLHFAVAEGELDAVIDLDSRENLLDGSFDLRLQRLNLDRLLAQFGIEVAGIELAEEGAGILDGRARLETRGGSLHELAAAADGELAFVMGGGRINALIIEAIGLDLGEALGIVLTEPDEGSATTVPVQCFIGRFDVRQGVATIEALVLETSDSTITGKGQIDLGAETLALEVLAYPKDASVLTASTPVRIEGTFKEPTVDVVSEELMAKSLAALALGVVLPVVGAILPFFEPGETTSSNCAHLLEAAAAAMPATPPGTPAGTPE